MVRLTLHLAEWCKIKAWISAGTNFLAGIWSDFEALRERELKLLNLEHELILGRWPEPSNLLIVKSRVADPY